MIMLWSDLLRLLVVQLNIHAVVNFVVLQLYVVLERGVPFLQHYFIPLGAGLGRYKFL